LCMALYILGVVILKNVYIMDSKCDNKIRPYLLIYIAYKMMIGILFIIRRIYNYLVFHRTISYK